MEITHPCRWCGRQVYTVTKMSTNGWLLILFGLLLCGVGVIPAWIIAEFTMRESFVSCDSCGRQ